MLLVGLSVVGLIDALLLTVEHYASFRLPCTATGGCEQVLTSKYATVFGIPTATFGVIFYGVVLALGVHWMIRKEVSLTLLRVWATIGFAASLGLTYIQGFVLHAWCQYCLLSALTTTAIFGLSFFMPVFHKHLKGGKNESNG